MDKLISLFTANIDEAIAIAEKNSISKNTNEIRNILICGMGGSGIGGKLIAQWIANDIKIPVTLCSDYTIPAFVNENTLVIASSYSGNTEETMEAVNLAKEKGAFIKAISSGGKLEAFCKANNYDCIIVPGGNQPRAAIAYSLVQLIHILSALNLISDKILKDFISGRDLINAELEQNKVLGKQIAQFFFKKVGIIYSETAYEGVAVRARQQLNENSKFLGWSLAIPEMNHNELVGWGGGDDRFAVLFLESEDAHPRNAKRIELTKEIVSSKTKNVYTLKAKGENYIARSLYLINVLDWASFYLVDMNQVDVFDIDVINHLKNSLANL